RVEQISTENILMAQTTPDEESLELEIDFTTDQIEAIPAVEQIDITSLVFATLPADDNLEISNDPEPVHSVEIISEISYNNDHLAYEPLADENIEINFRNDLVKSVQNIPGQLTLKSVELVSGNTQGNPGSRNIYSTKTVVPENGETTEVENSNESLLVYNEIESGSSEIVVESVEPAQNNNLYYLRESVTFPAVIETSRSDREIMELALTRSDELTYEELLYAASLASKLNDKLTIYNNAFIHIDRDWRAFNNAAVTSLQMKDFDRAECYLNQASMITTNNGKVQNNYGILACYKKDYNKAKEYFISASELGSSAKYNLEVVSTIVANNANMGNTINAEVDLIETLGDIIDYTSGSND
ncbi:MAG: hypothetical protein JW731_16220, partial [Bacteroidales bacterium]|nr:hypothetical protein [Bacteroidales bacterium]